MTFFGPSLCSIDSDLIITASFDERALTRDQTSITANYTALEYYDNTTQLYTGHSFIAIEAILHNTHALPFGLHLSLFRMVLFRTTQPPFLLEDLNQIFLPHLLQKRHQCL